MAKNQKTPQQRVLTENQRYLKDSTEHVNALVEISKHLATLTAAGCWCQVYFDDMTTLNGAPPKCGVVVVKMDEEFGVPKNTTLMNLKPSRATVSMILEDLRTLVGESQQTEGA